MSIQTLECDDRASRVNRYWGSYYFFIGDGLASLMGANNLDVDGNLKSPKQVEIWML